ncbi:MAG: hypothetical protein R6W48_04710 [Gaiellaceae bacterium]
MTTRALAALDDVLARADDADEVLRATVEILVSEPGVSWAGIAFLENGALVLGPMAGIADEPSRRGVPIAFQGDPVGELQVDGEAGPELLERVASLIATYVLIGWDTRGEQWTP